MKLIQRQIPRICLEYIYEYMILPIIEYADVIYDNLPNRLVKDLELLQRQAALWCTGGYKHTKHVELLKELGWEQLSLRRKCHRLFIMYKIINNNTPLYLKRLIPDTVVDHTGYNLRSANNFTIPIYVKSFCKKSFIPQTLREWNELSMHIRSSSTFAMFKTSLKCMYFKNEKHRIRNIPGPNAIYLYRLRMGLSGLNMHRSSYHFIDSPLCSACNDNEDTLHFVVVCQRYAAQRGILLDELAT